MDKGRSRMPREAVDEEELDVAVPAPMLAASCTGTAVEEELDAVVLVPLLVEPAAAGKNRELVAACAEELTLDVVVACVVDNCGTIPMLGAVMVEDQSGGWVGAANERQLPAALDVVEADVEAEINAEAEAEAGLLVGIWNLSTGN